jgi:hypothetical protein
MKIDDLIPSLVPYENYEGAVVLFDIIIDEYRNTLVKLLPHAEGGAKMRGSKKSWKVENRHDNHVVI